MDVNGEKDSEHKYKCFYMHQMRWYLEADIQNQGADCFWPNCKNLKGDEKPAVGHALWTLQKLRPHSDTGIC